MKKILVCTTCGSPRITFDALIDPNKNNEVVTIFDNSDCQDCGGSALRERLRSKTTSTSRAIRTSNWRCRDVQ